jgi:hypothetical protein
MNPRFEAKMTMTDSQRLNGMIRAWEAGKPAFTCFAKVDKLSRAGNDRRAV